MLGLVFMFVGFGNGDRSKGFWTLLPSVFGWYVGFVLFEDSSSRSVADSFTSCGRIRSILGHGVLDILRRVNVRLMKEPNEVQFCTCEVLLSGPGPLAYHIRNYIVPTLTLCIRPSRGCYALV